MSNANRSFILSVLFTSAVFYDPHASVFFGGTGETKDQKMKADFVFSSTQRLAETWLND
jgi:hypothetical protein